MMNISILKKLTSYSLILLGLVVTLPVNAQRMTISDGQIPYFAMLKGTTSRSMIVSNPDFCKQAPGPCNFFIESAYGHTFRNHLIQRPNHYTLFDLKQADCFAARSAPAKDVRETYELLLNPEEAAKYSIPNDLTARAENIKACAIKAKNWQE